MSDPLNINTDLARRLLVGFLHEEITRVGITRAVIGLSGGIDSALSCFLAAEALGPENVLAVRMPYRTSAPESMADAQKVIDQLQKVIDQLGVQHLTVEITDMAEPLLKRFPEMSNVRRGNIMARTRMIVLYDQSSAFGGLVVGTSNKTEIMLGYSTLFGDSACALNPIGDLYKTQVRQLSRALGVPASILDKAPSADLWPGQTDEKEMGLTYEGVDRLLYLLVDQRYKPEECIEAGFDAGFVQMVVERIRRNHFKRIMPPIAKVSRRTVGYDFLYLRDWGT